MAYGHSGKRQFAEGKLAPSANANRFLIAAWNNGKDVAAHFNGKIDSPTIYGEALEPEALLAFPGTRDEPPPERAIADWDFSQGISGDLGDRFLAQPPQRPHRQPADPRHDRVELGRQRDELEAQAGALRRDPLPRRRSL